MKLRIALAIACLGAVAPLFAQDNYEIQVYGAETVAPHVTMVELHSNLTMSGHRAEDGLDPTQHALHETLEITRGLTAWSEVGFYVFTAIEPQHSWQWVGSHIRPRVRVPESWRWPAGVSLSAEAGYQRRAFSQDTWTIELRPIIDKQLGRWYASLNPTIDRAIRTDGGSRALEFSPNATVTFDATHAINLGIEYYGALGPVTHFDSASEQQHQLFGVVNLNVSPEWEFNCGYGVALTHAGDRRWVKMILGRRIGGK